MAIELLFGRKQATYFTKSGVTEVKLLQLDAAPREEHRYQNEVTRYPLENGAAISDNIRGIPEELTIDGFITNAPVRYLAGLRDALTYDEGVSHVQDGFEILMRMAGYSVTTTEGRTAIPTEPLLVDIFTSLRVFTDMVMTNFSIPRDAQTGDALRFSASFVKIEKADLETSKVINVSTKKTGTAGVDDQAPEDTKVNKQTTTKPSEHTKSWAAEIYDHSVKSGGKTFKFNQVPVPEG